MTQCNSDSIVFAIFGLIRLIFLTIIRYEILNKFDRKAAVNIEFNSKHKQKCEPKVGGLGDINYIIRPTFGGGKHYQANDTTSLILPGHDLRRTSDRHQHD